MLLARLQREAERPPAGAVGRRADQPPRHFAHERLLARHEPARRSPQRHWDAQRLRVADGDVRPELPRPLQQRTTDRIDRRDHHRPRLMADRREPVERLDAPQKIGRLDQHGRRIVVDRPPQILRARAPAGRLDHDEVHR